MSTIKIEDIRAALAEQGWTLLSEEYHNLDEELIYLCSEGHKVYGPWKKFRNKCECPECKKNSAIKFSGKIVPKPKNVTRILALDQATYVTGWSVFDDEKLVSFGKFQTSLENEMGRCTEIKSWLISMANNWQPDLIGLEGIQFQETAEGKRAMGVTVFETLAHLQGILMQTCYELNIKYDICHTNTWRSYCGVKGRTRTDKKRSMQNLVKKWYDLSVTDDESDAIGIGKYYAEKKVKPMLVENWE